VVLKRLSLWCVVASSALVLFGCSEGFDRKTGTYTDKGKGFTVQFPAGWDKTKPPPGALFSVADPDNKANINVMVQNLPGNVTFDQYLKQVSSRQGMAGARQRDDGDITIDGVAGYWSVRDISVGGVRFTSLSYYVMKGERVYSIVCVANANDYPSLEATFDGVATSFRFLS